MRADAGLLKAPMVRKVVEKRCRALAVLRLLAPAPYILDARRLVATMPDEGMARLTLSL